MSSTQLTLAEALAKLAPPGATAPSVARALRRARVTGISHDSCHCPVARYLTQEVGAKVRVDPIAAWVGHGTSAPLVRADLPYAVRDFIQQFDAAPGQFPHLCPPYIARHLRTAFSTE